MADLYLLYIYNELYFANRRCIELVQDIIYNSIKYFGGAEGCCLILPRVAENKEINQAILKTRRY